MTLHHVIFLLSLSLSLYYYILQLTWADVAVADLFHPEGLASRCKNFNMKSVAPKLAAHVEKVNGLPKIKKWLEERPQPKK